jgi:hypothetical protein
MSEILTTFDGPVATVTINRPTQMNALSAAVRAGLVETFAALNDNQDVKVAILTGAGERAFCAGLDLKELGAGGTHPQAIVEGQDDPVSTLNRFRKPIIGAINGVAITGGFEVALACDVFLVSSNARFADTHAASASSPSGASRKNSPACSASPAPRNSRSPAISSTPKPRSPGASSTASPRPKTSSPPRKNSPPTWRKCPPPYKADTVFRYCRGWSAMLLFHRACGGLVSRH